MWHGADITYILWGMLSGLFQIMEALIAPLRAHFPRWLKVFFTFMLFTFSMFLFRSDDISQAGIIIGKVFTQFEFSSIFTTSLFELGLGTFHMLYLFAGIVVLIIYDIINEKTKDAAAFIASKSAYPGPFIHLPYSAVLSP